MIITDYYGNLLSSAFISATITKTTTIAVRCCYHYAYAYSCSHSSFLLVLLLLLLLLLLLVLLLLLFLLLLLLLLLMLPLLLLLLLLSMLLLLLSELSMCVTGIDQTRLGIDGVKKSTNGEGRLEDHLTHQGIAQQNKVEQLEQNIRSQQLELLSLAIGRNSEHQSRECKAPRLEDEGWSENFTATILLPSASTRSRS